MAFLPLLIQSNYHDAGMVYREVATGEIETFALQTSDTAQTLIVERWTSPTAYSSLVVALGFLQVGPSTVLCIADDGVNRIAGISTDGQNFRVVHTVTRTTFLTADQVGFYVRDQNVTYPSAMTVLSWKQGTTCGL